jgi:catechol 2,3-dioxygenase-like lactoylglutathione lyase family enzyme
MKVPKDSIDLGIVISDPAKSLAFYRDLLGMKDDGEMEVRGGRMYRVLCGTSLVKLIKMDREPEGKPVGGGPGRGFGLRYFTIHVEDVRSLVAQLEGHGIKPLVPPAENRPGVIMAMVTDPDGNIVEFLQGA